MTDGEKTNLIPYAKGFIFGALFTSMSFHLAAGLLCGTLFGVTFDQNYANSPNIRKFLENVKTKLKK